MTAGIESLRCSDLKEGMEVSFDEDITTSQIDRFAAVSGDISPLHMDADFARSRGFEDRVAHGGLLVGLVSRLIGLYLPGRYCLFQKCQIGFVSPVYPGRTVRVTGVVDQVSEVTRSAIIKVTVCDAVSGQEYARGKVQIGFTDGVGDG